MRWAALLALLAVAGCGSGSTQSVEVTTTVQETTTVEAPATSAATTTTSKPAGNDPDDVDGQLDIRDLNATRTGALIAVSLKTYDPWSSNVLVGSPVKIGPNRLTVYYDLDLDGHADRRGRIIFAGSKLSIFLSGGGQQFEPVPVERPNDVTAQYVHPVDIFFVNAPSDIDIQIRAESLYNGQKDRAPDHGWIEVPFKP